MLKEEVRPLKNFESLYLISESGVLYSISKQKLINSSDRKGYPRVKLTKDGKHISFDVHRLVALTFLDNPDNLPCVMHIDDNPKNNNFKNLKWCTHLENMRDMYKKNRRITFRVKIKNVQTGEIFIDALEAAKKYNTSRSNIRQSCETGCKAKGFNWEFIN